MVRNAIVPTGAKSGVVDWTSAATLTTVKAPTSTRAGSSLSDSHPPIVYPMALTIAPSPEAPAFAAYLRGPAARRVFEAQGFTMFDPAPGPAR